MWSRLSDKFKIIYNKYIKSTYTETTSLLQDSKPGAEVFNSVHLIKEITHKLDNKSLAKFTQVNKTCHEIAEQTTTQLTIYSLHQKKEIALARQDSYSVIRKLLTEFYNARHKKEQSIRDMAPSKLAKFVRDPQSDLLVSVRLFLLSGVLSYLLFALSKFKRLPDPSDEWFAMREFGRGVLFSAVIAPCVIELNNLLKSVSYYFSERLK